MQTGRLEKSPRSNQGRGRSSQTSTIQGSKKIKQKVQEAADEPLEDILNNSRYVGQRIDWL